MSFKTTNAVPKPDINEWMNEFNVSTRYEIKKVPLDRNGERIGGFNLNMFKKKLKKGLILVGEAVS